MRDDFLSFDGTRLAVHHFGSGPVIILLHGLFSSGAMNWRKYGAAAQIASAGYHVVMPDFRGHGDSAAPHGPFPADVLAMDIEALVRHLQLTEFDLGGYSLGARTTVRLLARGMRPRRAVLGGMGLAGIVDGKTRGDWFLGIIADPHGQIPGSAGAAAAAFMKQSGIDGAAVAGVLRSQVSTPIETLRCLDVRTLLVSGAQDSDNGSAAELALELPTAAYVEIPGNHMSAVTKPDFGAAIAAWLGHD